MTSSPEPDSASSQPAATPPVPFIVRLPDDPASNKDWHLWAGVLLLLTLVAYQPATQAKFIWDDDKHITQNKTLRSPEGLVRAWAPPIWTPQYYPLTHTTFWVEYHLWGLNPMGYHIVNIVLHALSAVIVWRLLRRLGVPGAWLAAAIWAVHPLQVESVAWITERKNVLSGLLFFSSIWFFLEFAGITPPKTEDSKKTTWLIGDPGIALGLALLLFAGAMLSKTVACCEPVVLLAILWWKRRLDGKTAPSLIPFFLIGLILAYVTIRFETTPGGAVVALGKGWEILPIQRLLIAGRAVWFYIGKLLFPYPLMFSYPKVVPAVDDPLAWLEVLAAVALVVVLFVFSNRIGRGWLAAAICYGAALFPSLGFFDVFTFNYTYVADHYQYLAGLAPIVVIVTLMSLLTRRWLAGADRAASLTQWPLFGGGALLVVLAILTMIQSSVYQSPLKLWRDVISKNDSSWMAHDNLGIELEREARQLQRDAAVATDPADAEADRTEATDDVGDAIHNFQRVLELNPDHFRSHTSLGLALTTLGHRQEAEPEFLQGIAGEKAVEADDLAHHRAVVRHDATPDLLYSEYLLDDARSQDALLRHGVAAASAADSQPTTQSSTIIDRDPHLKSLSQAIDAHYEQAFTVLKDAEALLTEEQKSRSTQELAVEQMARVHYDLGEVYFHRFNIATSDTQASDSLDHARERYALAVTQLPDADRIIRDDAMLKLGVCLRFEHRVNDAYHVFKELALVDPNSFDVWMNLAVVAGQVATPQQPDGLLFAKSFLEKALTISPNDPGAQQMLRQADAQYKQWTAATQPTTQSATQPATQP